MTYFNVGANNFAGSGSTVGIQADEVHNSHVYVTAPDASPYEKYQVGLNYLDAGVPSQARALISDAIAHNHDDGEVRFHWVLAMLSKRSYHDLSAEEREQLMWMSSQLDKYADDEWKRALKAIYALLDSLKDLQADPAPALRKLEALPAHQHEMIVRHLDLVLTGGMKDSLWAQTRKAAEEGQYSEDRLGRVWAYFHRPPAYPRAREPAEEATTPGDRVRAVVWSGVSALALGYIGWLVVVHATLLPLLAYVLALAAGYGAARNGLEWRYRVERLTLKDNEYLGRTGAMPAPEKRFANQVDHSFQHYFFKYAPKQVDRSVWLAETMGIRNSLRDEIIELYGESRLGIDPVNWLIRYLARDVAKRWENGTLLNYRERYRTPLTTKAWCLVSFALTVAAAIPVISTAVRASVILGVSATVIALISGQAAGKRWLRIFCERRRVVEDKQEHDLILAKRYEEYWRWKSVLDEKRPSEKEMENWLNCDKTMLLDEALQHYRLAWRDIIAHAFLQTPVKNSKRARVRNGPWRYSKYNILLFLVTKDGVREVSTELDFERVTRNGEERKNFRFDAVSSVRVVETSEFSYTLNLTLTNGPDREIQVTEPDVHEASLGENPATFAQMNLDVTGFTHALHILEGIAADGKGWIDRRFGLASATSRS